MHSTSQRRYQKFLAGISTRRMADHKCKLITAQIKTNIQILEGAPGMNIISKKIIVKLFVHFDLLLFGQRLTLKSLFTLHPHPPENFFLVSNERYGQINTFLLRYYGTDFASIKRYGQFCFLLLYIRRHRYSLLSLLSALYLSLSSL